MCENVTVTWTVDDTRTLAARQDISLTCEDIQAFHGDCDFWLMTKIHESISWAVNATLRQWHETRNRDNRSGSRWRPLEHDDIIRHVERHLGEAYINWKEAFAGLSPREQNVLTYALHVWVKTVAEDFPHTGSYWRETIAAGYVHPDLWRLDSKDKSVVVLVEKGYLVLAPGGDSVKITLDGARVVLEGEPFANLDIAFDQRQILEAIERLILICDRPTQ